MAEDGDPWEPFRVFLGSWRGEERGVSGEGTGERTYRLVLGDQFLFMKNRSTFEPQEENPPGEVHEDHNYLSYDGARKQYVLRSFHSEGFVNRYAMQRHEPGGTTFVFLSESIENAPPGFRARLTVHVRSSDAFEETFELARPGEEFQVLLKNRWERA